MASERHRAGAAARTAAGPTVDGKAEAIADLMLEVAQCLDRKSTRLNSSHSQISYAVFCLKKNRPTGGGGDHRPSGRLALQPSRFQPHQRVTTRSGTGTIALFQDVRPIIGDDAEEIEHHLP